jgi:hypothetical protein
MLPFVPSELRNLVQQHPACNHVFLQRIGRAEVNSTVMVTFAAEYGLLRRAARVLDARCPGNEARYREFAQSCGIRGAHSLTQALPGTRMAIDGLQVLQRDLERREGALWAMEQIGRQWGQLWRQQRPEPNRGLWDGYWRELSMGDNLIADPDPRAEGLDLWEAGLLQALNQTSTFLDSLEAAIQTLYAA